ncbi:UDP-N-acetylglucosamine acyltransferase [Lampropedia aestuarii]|uniref:UDP-N-acetylglucosamine acyltransferase n=1 Tax=Lampropedia aestuarii TaxID=2562762 RepID=UPI00246984FC|nr:UDP-N-acetylglucosamine acyltransferase [Lampropedia aestuarii]MDH5858825.1 UDP-N-acetylglucosamine acyltransferase [Lampropedia aestuarii]
MKLWKLAALSLAIGLAGCQSPSAYDFAVTDVHTSTQKIDAQLGTVTVTMDSSDKRADLPKRYQGVDRYWQESLQEALKRSAIFKATAGHTADLQVTILAVEFPSLAVDFKTQTIARYALVDKRSGAVLFSKEVQAEGEVPSDYAFIGRTRARESINRSAQNNIKQFLQQLEAADIRMPAPPAK